MNRTKEQSARYWKKASSKPGFRELQRQKNKIRRERHGAFLARIKDVPCADCGGRFHHSQMEFDHRPGEQKLIAIGREKSAALSRLLREIDKCDIVCANCHALRTWKRAQIPGGRSPGSLS